MVERTGALGYFGDARRPVVGTELTERVTGTGSLVIRKLSETRAGELAISSASIFGSPRLIRVSGAQRLLIRYA